MDIVAGLCARYFPGSREELSVGKVSVSKIAKEFGTPLFVYDRGLIEARWRLLRETLPPEFHVAYSVKANPNRAILRSFLQLGARLEIASAGEFCQARSAGCKPENIIFAGPGKSPAELEMVLSQGIGEIHAESPLEIERIASIASRLGVRARVAIRVNPGGEAEGGAMRMGGRPAAFGVDEENIDPVLDRLLTYPSIEFGGIHLFAGTQILDANTLTAQYAKGLEIGRHIAKRTGRSLPALDFGGGLGIPYFPHEKDLDTGQLRQNLQVLWTTVRNDPAFVGTSFLVEPGRYLIGEAGIYLASVIDVKISRGKHFVIVDGGMNHHLAASGNLGQTIKRNYPIAVVNKLSQPATSTVEVAGPLCTPLDVLGRSVALPNVEPGDLIAVFQSGAYGRSASPMGFLSHAAPAEVLVEGQQLTLIRRRGEYSDYLRDQPD
jgi:diaminopimelate decarboxylase